MITDEKLEELLSIVRNNHWNKPLSGVLQQETLTCGEMEELLTCVPATGSVRDELRFANSQLAASEAFIERMIAGYGNPKDLRRAASTFYEWLLGARIERASAIREALDESEPACSSCKGALTCRTCSWGC